MYIADPGDQQEEHRDRTEQAEGPTRFDDDGLGLHIRRALVLAVEEEPSDQRGGQQSQPDEVEKQRDFAHNESFPR